MQEKDKSVQIPAQPYRVGLWPVPGFAMMSCASVFEPLRAANLLAGAPLFEIVVFGDAAGAVSSSGAVLPSTHRVGDRPALDLFLVVAGGDPFGFDDPAALDWLRALAADVPTLGGVSGGPVILARAGLLAGRSCTVHWEHAEGFAKRHRDVSIKRRLYVMERDRVTCGGGNAPLDLMHAVIARRHGKAFARRVSDWFLHTEIRDAGAQQRWRFAPQRDSAPVAVQDAVAVMEDHLSDPLSLAQLSLISGTSARHLNRLFRTAFGTSTMAFYRQMRLEKGRALVEGSRLGLSEIAEATGFHAAGHFSDQYLRAFGHRPSRGRETGRAPHTAS